MVWLNDQHINVSVPPGTFGGSMCTCVKCQETRQNKGKLSFPIDFAKEVRRIHDGIVGDNSEEHY